MCMTVLLDFSVSETKNSVQSPSAHVFKYLLCQGLNLSPVFFAFFVFVFFCFFVAYKTAKVSLSKAHGGGDSSVVRAPDS